MDYNASWTLENPNPIQSDFNCNLFSVASNRNSIKLCGFWRGCGSKPEHPKSARRGGKAPSIHTNPLRIQLYAQLETYRAIQRNAVMYRAKSPCFSTACPHLIVRNWNMPIVISLQILLYGIKCRQISGPIGEP